MQNDELSNQFTIENISNIFTSYIRKKNIIGIDNIDNRSFQFSLANFSHYIASNIQDYKYSPYLEKLISKGRAKCPRVISIPTIKDRIVLYIIKDYLHRLFPECVNTELINIRIQDIYDFIKTTNNHSFIRLDIKEFYNTINQKILMDLLKQRISSELCLSLIDKGITNPTVPKKSSVSERSKYNQDVGIPQGLSISNVLANIYLNNLDIIYRSKTNYYYRYVDDILVIIEKEKGKIIFENIQRELRKLGLQINPEKTILISNESKIPFLGYEIDKDSISIKKESLQGHINSTFALLCSYRRLLENKELREKWITTEQLLERFESEINEKITGAISDNRKYGWLFYFSSITNKDILHKLDQINYDSINRIIPKQFVPSLKLKSYVRAFYEIKHRPRGGYITDYDVFDSFTKKREYLDDRGYLDSDKLYSEEEIDFLFLTVKERNLSRMQKDIGSLS